MEQTKCYIIEDLLPLYVDDLVQDNTRTMVEEHLQGCDNCRSRYEQLINTVKIMEDKPIDSIDFLKTIRKKNRLKTGIIVIGLLLALGLGWLGKQMIWGTPSEAFHTKYGMITEGPNEYDFYWEITGKLWGSGEVFTRHKIIEKEDRREVIFYVGLPLWLKRYDEMKVQVPRDKIVEINGELLYPDGQVVTKLARDLYAARTPYIGDNSAVLNLMQILQIERLTPYTIELDTGLKPKGLIIHAEREVGSREENELYRFSEVLMALIDNCDYVRWEFPKGGSRAIQIDRLMMENEYGDLPFDVSESEKGIQYILTPYVFWPE